MRKNLPIALALIASVHCGLAQETKPAKAFIDYFLPTPIVGKLSKDVWGAAMDRDLQGSSGTVR